MALRRASLTAASVMLAAASALSPVSLAAQRAAAKPAQAKPTSLDTAGNMFLQSERREDPTPAPARKEGEGPFTRLIVRGVNLIDGYGSAPRGPVDVVIEGNRIVQIASVGYPNVKIDETKRPKGAVKEIDANGMYMMPGLVDLHVHQGTQQKAPDSEYYNKLWLANGITAVRGVPFASFDYSIKERERSAKNEIAAPRYIVYQRPGTGWGKGIPRTPDTAREWVRWAKANGADGLKLGAERPDIMEALLDEAKKLGLGSTAHLQQQGVAQMNGDMATKLGLEAITHFYGIFESMYENHQVQPWPLDANLQDEQLWAGRAAVESREAREYQVERVPEESQGSRRHARPHDDHVSHGARCHEAHERAVAREVHHPYADGVLRAEPDQPRRVFLQLDDGR
jgi:hypothetical protein